MSIRRGIHAFAFLLLGMLSCKYEPNDVYFEEISPPSPFHQLEIGLWPSGDTIMIFNKTQLRANVNTYGLTIHKGIFTLDNQTWQSTGPDLSFFVDPQKYKPGFYDLSLELFTNSGTQSLADMLGTEGYIVKRNWVVVIDGRPAPEVGEISFQSKGKHLMVSWPKLNQFNFKYYEVSYEHSYAKSRKIIIRHPDSCSFVDTVFCGGDIFITVRNHVFTNDLYNTKSIRHYEELPEMRFESIGLDSLRILWHQSKFKCRYSLYTNHQSAPIFVTNKDTCVTIESPGFAYFKYYWLEIAPFQSASVVNNLMTEWRNYVLGTKISKSWLHYAYNVNQKALYTSYYENIQSFDIYSMSQIGSYNLEDNFAHFSSPSNSARVAVLSDKKITIFEDKSLSGPSGTLSHNYGSNIDHFLYTDNGYIAIAKPNQYIFFSATQQSIVTTISIENYPVYSKWACIATSQDGRFAGICSYEGILIYDIFEGNSSLIYSDNRSYRSVSFHPIEKEKLLITFKGSNDMEIRNAGDFSLIKAVQLPSPSLVICNIDPESGNLLLTDYDYLYVYNYLLEKVLLKVKCDDMKPKVFNNRLFSYNGYHLDITEYLLK